MYPVRVDANHVWWLLSDIGASIKNCRAPNSRAFLNALFADDN